jgi:hypothetical protein
VVVGTRNHLAARPVRREEEEGRCRFGGRHFCHRETASLRGTGVGGPSGRGGRPVGLSGPGRYAGPHKREKEGGPPWPVGPNWLRKLEKGLNSFLNILAAIQVNSNRFEWFLKSELKFELP